MRTYDHRLVQLVQRTGDIEHAIGLGVPRSTAAGWLRQQRRSVVSAAWMDEDAAALRLRVARLEARVHRLRALLSLAFAVIRVAEPDLTHLRIPASGKARLLRAIDRSLGVVRLSRVLTCLGISASRLSAWRRAERGCDLVDQPSCPASSPQRLTPNEIAAVREMVTSPTYRHVPTGSLALLAQRIGAVFASATTWHRLVRERGWRRPRLRLYPAKPRHGIRAERPDALWHIDTTLIKLIDGRKTYLHAVIDNFSRRILAWRLNERFDPGVSAHLLIEAGEGLGAHGTPPTLLADGGIENFNGGVDAVVDSGRLRRVLAQMDISFSNSLIEAWWRQLKHQWLYLHQLDTPSRLRKLVARYVEQHNTHIPHSAFKGQTPDEMYFGKGGRVPEQLAAARARAREERMAENRAQDCRRCACQQVTTAHGCQDRWRAPTRHPSPSLSAAIRPPGTS